MSILGDDSWKGEHLIRARKDKQAAAENWGALGARVRRQKKGNECAVPECSVRISPTGVAGVCRRHNHKAPYCRCRQCRK